MSNREKIAAATAVVLGGLFGILSADTPYGFACIGGLFAAILAGVVCCITDRNEYRWGIAANALMVITSVLDIFVRRLVLYGFDSALTLPLLVLLVVGLGGGSILALLVAAPVTASRKARRLRSKDRLQQINGVICASCGYDLRASTVRCPECGTPFSRASQ